MRLEWQTSILFASHNVESCYATLKNEKQASKRDVNRGYNERSPVARDGIKIQSDGYADQEGYEEKQIKPDFPWLYSLPR